MLVLAVKSYRWLHNEEEGISVRLSYNGTRAKIEFFGYEAAKRTENRGIDLENKDRIAPSITTNDEEFYTNPYWKNKIKNNLSESSELDLNKEKARNIANSLCMGAETAMPSVINESRDKEEKKREEQVAEESAVDEDWAKNKAEEWLESPDLLSKIDRVIHHHLVGETTNALLIFLSMVSAKTKEPNTVRPVGESSIGKTFLVTRVAKLIPDDMKFVRKGFSEMAVWNKAKPIEGVEDRRIWSLWGKVLILLEEETAEDFLEQFRPVLSHDEKKITYEVTNTESKSRETLKIDIVGWPAYIGMQVGGSMDEQERTRAMNLTPDSGKQKYRKAVWWNSKKKETPWLDHMREAETEVAKNIVSKLDGYKVIMPFRMACQKWFPTSRRRHMRDWSQFQSLVESMTVLHQRQRPKIEIDGEKYLIAHPDDVKAVVMIAKEALAETLLGLDQRMRRFWKHLKEKGRVRGYTELQDEYKACFGESASKSTIREKYIQPLEDMGMIGISQGKGSRPHTFTASGDISTLSPKLEKVAKAAYDFDIKDSTFGYLSSTEMGPKEPPKITDFGDWMDENPIEGDDIDVFKDFWSNLMEIPSIVENNKEILQKTYEDDYGYNISQSEGEDKGDLEIEPIDESKEDEIELIDERMPQNELVEMIAQEYDNLDDVMTDDLDYPHIVDFAEIVAEKTGEDKERIMEASNRLEEERNDIIFDKSGVD